METAEEARIDRVRLEGAEPPQAGVEPERARDRSASPGDEPGRSDGASAGAARQPGGEAGSAPAPKPTDG